MKRLTLLRHAKADPGGESLPDRERSLTERGRSDVQLMAQRLRALGARPSLVLTSPARRALQTAQLICREIDYPLEFLQREHDLYLAAAGGILTVIAHQDNSFNDILVCGHNPGLTELASQLTGENIGNIPTCGVAVIEAQVLAWQDLRHGKLVAVDFPKRHRDEAPGPRA
jgi:phosphohistidine phosphatase